MKIILKLIALFSLFSHFSFSADDYVKSKNPEVEAIETQDINWGKCTETVFELAHSFIQTSLDQKKIFPVKYDQNGKKRRKTPFYPLYYKVPRKVKDNKKLEREFHTIVRNVLQNYFVGPQNRAIVFLEKTARLKPMKKKSNMDFIRVSNHRNDGMAF